jgi:hypothetical protein
LERCTEPFGAGVVIDRRPLICTALGLCATVITGDAVWSPTGLAEIRCGVRPNGRCAVMAQVPFRMLRR